MMRMMRGSWKNKWTRIQRSTPCSRFIETQSGQSTLYIVVGARAYWSLGETYHVRHSHFCVPPLLVYRSQLLVCNGALNTK